MARNRQMGVVSSKHHFREPRAKLLARRGRGRLPQSLHLQLGEVILGVSSQRLCDRMGLPQATKTKGAKAARKENPSRPVTSSIATLGIALRMDAASLAPIVVFIDVSGATTSTTVV